MTVVLLMASALAARSFIRLAELDLGFDSYNVLTFTVLGTDETRITTREQGDDLLERLLARLRQDPRVEAAAAVNQLPFVFGPTGWDSSFVLEGQVDSPETSSRNPRLNLQAVTPDSNGPLAGFNPDYDYAWKIAEFAGGITGFAPQEVLVNTGATNGANGFFPDTTGRGLFSVAQGDTVANGAPNQLYIIYNVTYQPPYVVRGEARCAVSPDGLYITGQSMDPAVGMQPVQLRRVG